MIIGPEIKVGDVFSRTDVNGNVWTAEVINRTDQFVDVKKISPYKRKVANSDESGSLGCWHWEDSEPEYERAMINETLIDMATGEKVKNIFGELVDEYKKFKTGEYIIILTEYDKWNKYYKKAYYLDKYKTI